MKFLIIHRHSRATGVSTFLESLSRNLISKGHVVSMFIEDNSIDIFYPRFIHAGINIVNYPVSLDYDVIIHNYNDLSQKYKNVYRSSAVNVSFVHGIMDENYMPDPLSDIVFTFGERSRDYFDRLFGIESTIIRNGIDLSLFHPKDELGNEVFISDLRHGFAIQSALRDAGVDSVTFNTSLLDVRTKLHNSKLVIGIGRSLFEAMACGIPCINLGVRSGDGYVTKHNFKDMLITNGSGWTNRSIPSIFDDDFVPKFLNEFNKFNVEDRTTMRKLAEQYVDINKQVDIIINKIQEIL